MLIFASGFLYWVLITTLEKEDERFLTSRVHVLDSLLQEQPESREALEREVAEENVGFADSQYRTYSRILNEAGYTLYEAPGMSQEIPPAVFPDPDESAGKVKKWRSANNRTYLLIATWSGEGLTPQSRRKIQVALDETDEEVLVSRYERYLIGVLLMGILASAIIGIVTAQRGMRPLADIARAAERITASQLHERIDATRWPRELVLLARAFDGMLDRLEGSFNRLSQFSADLAHELRTPINNLRGEAEVALSRPREADEYREILASSLEEYGRLSRMIHSLLFLAKADAAQAVVTSLPSDARTEIEKLTVFYEALAAEQGVRVICEGDGTLDADPILFRRAVSNLLSNALHYTPSGGKITFSIRPVDGAGTEIICSDTGTGIAQEHLPKIFDRFYRVEPSRTVQTEGAGLGLAIVNSIASLHGGKITVQSVIGEGTSIRLFFPAKALLPVKRSDITRA
jgi:two-component system heavy metal sensor histidine kinase CusS